MCFLLQFSTISEMMGFKNRNKQDVQILYISGAEGAFSLSNPLAIDIVTIPVYSKKDGFTGINLNVGILCLDETGAANLRGYTVWEKSISLKRFFPNRAGDFTPKLHP